MLCYKRSAIREDNTLAKISEGFPQCTVLVLMFVLLFSPLHSTLGQTPDDETPEADATTAAAEHSHESEENITPENETSDPPPATETDTEATEAADKPDTETENETDAETLSAEADTDPAQTTSEPKVVEEIASSTDGVDIIAPSPENEPQSAPQRAAPAALRAESSSLATETIVIQPDPITGKDTRYGTFYQKNGDPDGVRMSIGGWADWYYSLIEFPLNTLPVDPDNILNVQLHLYNVEVNGRNFGRIERVTEPWTEASPSLRNRIESTNIGIAWQQVPDNDWWIVDITNLTKDWVAGTHPNYGMKLFGLYNSGNLFKNFVTSDDLTEPEKWPKLVVEIVAGTAPNQEEPPSLTNLEQFKMLGIEQVGEDETIVGNSAVFKATVNDEDSATVQLEVEVKPEGEMFDGTDTKLSEPVTSGTVAEVIVDELIPKDDHYTLGGNRESFHWRARAIDVEGNTSPWEEFGIPDNIDFSVVMVPLFTQIESEFPSAEDTALWANRNYGSGRYLDCLDITTNPDPALQRSTIRRCGCAITSMIMLAQYYGIQNSIENNPINPEDINAWLTNNGGYHPGGIDTGDVIWGKTIEYLGVRDANPSKTLAQLTLDYHNTTDLSVVDNYLDNQQPAVAYSARYGHYFVLDSKLATASGNTYTVRDPLWFNTKTLNDLEDLGSDIRGYNNTFTRANLFSFSQTPESIAAEMYLYLASPAEFLVTDEQERRLGKNPETGEVFSEIPNGTYTIEGPTISSETALDPAGLHERKVIRIQTPDPGNYDVQVIGTGSGSYTVSSLIYDNNGNAYQQVLEGETEEGETTTYDLTFTPEEPDGIDIVESPTLEELLSRYYTAVGEAGLKRKLEKRLGLRMWFVEYFLKKNRVHIARLLLKTLDRFIERRENKSISSEDAAILTGIIEDIQVLLKK